MRYTNRISRRQVIRAFDLYQKRSAAEAYMMLQDSPLLKHNKWPLQLTPKRLPPAVTLKAIAATCGMSYQTLARLIDGDFRIKSYRRTQVVKHAQRYFRP